MLNENKDSTKAKRRLIQEIGLSNIFNDTRRYGSLDPHCSLIFIMCTADLVSPLTISGFALSPL